MDGSVALFLSFSLKLQKRICRTVSPSFAASYEPLTRRLNIASQLNIGKYKYSQLIISKYTQLNNTGITLVDVHLN